jgi:two-component system sensor histidine kinase YesM
MRNLSIYKLFKTKLSMKIWLYLTLMVLSFILLIGLFIELYLRQFVEKDELNACLRNTNHAATAFSSEYLNILEHFVTYTASADFYSILKEIQESNSDEYIDLNTDLQSYLAQYSDISPLINASVITTKDNRVFHSYKFKMSDETLPYTLNYNLENKPPISVLPSAQSPFRHQSNVIAMTYLLKTEEPDKMVLLADNLADSDVILYFLLNTDKVDNFLKLYYNSDKNGFLYLADSTGMPITYSADNDNYKEISNRETVDCISQMTSSGASYEKLGNKYVLIRKIEHSDLYLVNIVPQNELVSKIREFDLFLLYLVVFTFLCIPLLGLLISIFVTKPLKKLMVSVKEIEDNTYTSLPNISKSDEIGQLSLSIDSMYQTIQHQIEMIKKEERENFKMEIRLLSEQINPHFLYNTLECINMEIYNRHNENASSMISSLGNYLRISLSYGKSQSLIQLELEQVKAFINIMNYRFHHSIKLTLNIDQQLLHMLILKSILQPLVENSIKHGFSIDSSNYFPISPLIDISIFREPESLEIVVMDNGAGIDIERANQIMKGEGDYANENHHVGLNNIYHRLNSFYSDVDISFSCIPFYENKVIIKIPYENFAEAQNDNK